MTVLRQLLQLLLHLICDTFATSIDTVICVAAGIVLGDKNLDLVFCKSLAKTGANLFEVFRFTP